MCATRVSRTHSWLAQNPTQLLLRSSSSPWCSSLSRFSRSPRAHGRGLRSGPAHHRPPPGLGEGDRVYILEKGMVRYHGSMTEFLGNEEVRRTHLAV
jgi:hypothetical protein